jgi:TetR/AcrR family transcriptional repressor of nem operon
MSAGRPKEFIEDEALEKASHLFWKKGYVATSTEELLKTMKIGKGNMYHNFGNKREVLALVIKKYYEDFEENFTKSTRKSKDPIAFIKSFFRDIAEQKLSAHKSGCFMGNLIAELANTDPGMQHMAIKVLAKFENVLKSIVHEAQRNGQLKSKEDPTVLARYLLNLWNGINITRRMYPNRKDLLPLIEFQLSILV